MPAPRHQQQQQQQHEHDEAAALRCCSYGTWYPQYAQHAFESVVLPLDPAFLAFLHEDGLVLHEQSEALPRRTKATEVVVEGVDYDPDDLYDGSGDGSADARNGGAAVPAASSSCSSSREDEDEDEEEQQPWPERFPGMHAALAGAIRQLGGLVAPRTNWSSPTDVLWLASDNSLRCRNPDEVMLLLKSSDRVGHDLEQLQHLQQQQEQLQPTQQQQEQLQPTQQLRQQQQQQQQPVHQQEQQDAAEQPSQQQPAASASTATSAAGGTTSSSGGAPPQPPELVLRRWADLLPERQFRCFVHGHALVGASQRDPSQHFPQLSQAGEGGLADIRARLAAFHAAAVGSSFPLSSYAMDVYVPPKGRPKLLDFSPMVATTSPLLFSWEELPYQHMHEQQDDQQQQQQQERHAGQEQQQHTPGDGGGSGGSAAPFELRVVRHEGMIAPGVRAATGMPLDMLGLQGAFEDMLQQVQQQQRRQQQQQ